MDRLISARIAIIKHGGLFLLALLWSFSAVYAADKTDHKMGAFLGAKNATHPSWFKESFLDLEEDVDEATAENKRLVIYFWQVGCPYCDQLWTDNFADPAVVTAFRQQFDIVALNMWGDREVTVGETSYSEKDFAAALGIKYTPTLLFFNEDKKIIHKLNGYVPVDNFRKSMAYVSGKHEKTQRFSEFSLKQSAPIANENVASAPLNYQDFFASPVYDLRAKQTNQRPYTAVFFEAPNCKNCDLLHQKTLQDPDTRALAKQFYAVQLNRHATVGVITPAGKKTTAKDWATELGIDYLPAMLFFDNSGKQVMRIDTQLRTFHVQSVFDYVLSGAYKNEPSFQRYISKRADRIRELGKDVDIFAY